MLHQSCEVEWKDPGSEQSLKGLRLDIMKARSDMNGTVLLEFQTFYTYNIIILVLCCRIHPIFSNIHDSRR